jgi:hypothetical protein
MNKINISLAVEHIEEKIRQIHTLILSKPHLREFVDTIHPIPNIYNGGGKIKLIVIGQDPTIVNKASRKRITTVLDLDKPGKMQRYIFRLCEGLGINPLKELYATNLFKNFFEEPPSGSSEVLDKFFEFWFPLLKEEISLFPDTPLITLGDNVLEFVTANNTDKCVRNYWGYCENWRMGASLPFKHILPNENLLGRPIFPFPRQPSILKQFYNERCKSYLENTYKRMKIESHEAA